MITTKASAWLAGFLFLFCCNLPFSGMSAGACTGGSAWAAEPEQVPPGVLEAWQTLRTAILAEDAAGVAASARLPLKSIDYGQDQVADSQDLANRFGTIFEPKLVELIRTDQCTPGRGDPGYEVDCANGYMIFGFEDTTEGYRLTYFGSINE